MSMGYLNRLISVSDAGVEEDWVYGLMVALDLFQGYLRERSRLRTLNTGIYQL